MDYKYQGIILAKYDIAEVDRIYTIYTKEAGKISVLGKGVRNPAAKLAGSLEPLTYAEIFVAKTKGRGKITGVIANNSFSGIKSNVAIIMRVFNAFNLFSRLITQEEKDERIFYLFLSYLETMEETSESPLSERRLDIITQGFSFQLLELLGYRIEVERCVVCANRLSPGNNFMSVERGGTICLDCLRRDPKGIKLTDESIKLVRVFLKNRLSNFKKIEASKSDVENLKKIVQKIVEWII